MDAPPQHQSAGWGLAIATLLAILGTLVVNTLSNIRPPGGQNVGEIANTLLAGVLITPANYAFAIWGVIYLGLIAYGIYQLGQRQRRDSTIRQVNGLLIGACIAQMIWIYLFTLQYFWLSILAMLGILLSLIAIYLRLHIGRPGASRSRRWFAHYPFSVYLGWISVATVVNIASALHVAGWQGAGLSLGWTIALILITATIAAIVIGTRRDVAFTLVYLWAYGAIAVRHADQPAIWLTASGAALGLGIWLLVRRRSPLPQLKTD